MHTENAVKTGLLKEADINDALFNTMMVQMRLGMFDGEPSKQTYGNLGPGDVCTPAHQELALEAARQGIVLLKNHGPVLPLSPRRHRPVAVIGPNSDVTLTMIGNYAGKNIIVSNLPWLVCFALTTPGESHHVHNLITNVVKITSRIDLIIESLHVTSNLGLSSFLLRILL